MSKLGHLQLLKDSLNAFPSGVTVPYKGNPVVSYEAAEHM